MNKKFKKIVAILCLSAIIGALGFSHGAPAENKVHADETGTKWTDPATVKVVDDALLQTLIDPRADGQSKVTYSGETWTPKRETYNPADRRWQGLISNVKVGNRHWACFYTGGKKEPDPFNYIVLCYSDDDGKTWVDPYIIVDHADLNKSNIMLVVPNLFVDEEGDLWLTYLQSEFWGVRFHNAECENIKDLTWDEPIAFGPMKTNQPPTIITLENGTTEWMVASESQVGDSHVGTTKLWVTKDKGKTWTLKSQIQSSAATARRWPESQVVQAEGGKLILASRIEGGTVGGVEVSISKDYGKTWGAYQVNLDKPFIGPGSKFFMLRLSSGNLLIVNHDTSSSRSKIKAWLSEDGGETWPYSLMLDRRDDVSYPSAFEKDGVIYATWDKGRYIEKEFRFSSFTEEDIKKGYILSENQVVKGIISRPTQYLDVASVNGAFPSYIEKPVGTKSAEIRDTLPTEITVTDDNGNEHFLKGKWKSAGYKENVKGYYLLTFEVDSYPLYLSDGKDKLCIVVRLTDAQAPENSSSSSNNNGGGEQTGGGCKSAVGASFTSLFAILGCACLLKRRSKEN